MNKRAYIKQFLLFIINPIKVARLIKHIIFSVPKMVKTSISFISFFILLIYFMTGTVLRFFEKIPLIGKLIQKVVGVFSKLITKPMSLLVAKIEAGRNFQVRRTYLIYLAYENLKVRKSRTIITILGMSVGVGIIVFLLSLGYGIERLVIGRVASLDELKIIDVVSSQNTELRMDRNTLKKIKNNDAVKSVIPLISLVGRVTYNKAQTDVVVYAANSEYLDIAKIKLIKGKTFSDAANKATILGGLTNNEDAEVAGESTQIQKGKRGKEITKEKYIFNILPGTYAKVWKECTISSEFLGYTTRIEGGYEGVDFWGGTYAPYSPFGRVGYDDTQEEYMGVWTATKVPLYTQSIDQEEYIPLISEGGIHRWELGCIQKPFVQYIEKIQSFASVLGEATSSASLNDKTATEAAVTEPSYEVEVISSDSAGIEYVTLKGASEAASLKKRNNVLNFQKKPSYEALISRGFARLLNIPEDKVVGTKLKISFIIAKSLMPQIEGRALTQTVDYEVRGLIDDEKQFLFMPISDMEKIGVTNFTQLKVLIKDKNSLPKIRAQIETYGYNTSSVVDTVEQIEALFRNLRLVLASIGLIALGVASLGMFNTLTVSLLERTREIGGMKVIGMVSGEIQDLFLAEAMIMGFSGGIGGLILGYVLGHLVSFLVSIVSLLNGTGYLQLTYIPINFIIFILILSFIVGIITGLYPSERAKKISALNALRYE